MSYPRDACRNAKGPSCQAAAICCLAFAETGTAELLRIVSSFLGYVSRRTLVVVTDFSEQPTATVLRG